MIKFAIDASYVGKQISMHLSPGAYFGQGQSEVLKNYAKQYNCTPILFKGALVYTCTEEDFLIIKLQCPDSIWQVLT